MSILTSCQEENNEVVIAKVQNYKLLKSELNTETPINLNTDDSLIFVQNYIHNWVVDHLISNKAAELIPIEVQKVEKKIEKYKLSLIAHEFEQFIKSVNFRLNYEKSTGYDQNTASDKHAFSKGWKRQFMGHHYPGYEDYDTMIEAYIAYLNDRPKRTNFYIQRELSKGAPSD